MSRTLATGIMMSARAPRVPRRIHKNCPAQIHERALCESADVGEGTIVEADAFVSATAVVGMDCRIGASAYVEGVIGDFVTIGRGALVARGVCVGDHAVVREGSFVVDDVAPYAFVAGDPARSRS